jgi:predicted DNA-binding antitoxin AbrB/MazE fold protein
MSQHVDAIYEHGVLKPIGPLSLPDRARVTLTISETTATAPPPTIDADALARQQRALDEARAAIAALPLMPVSDGLSNRDHDQILYGGKS